METATDAYKEFLKQNQKDVIKAVEENRQGFEGLKVVLMNEQNATLKQIGGLLAIIADELHNRGGSK